MKSLQPSQQAVLGLFGVGGAGVLASYAYLFYRVKASKVDLWFGMPKTVQYVYYAFMIAAALGMCAFTGWYCFSEKLPTRGLLSNAVVPCVLYAIVLGGSAAWALIVAQFASTSSTSSIPVAVAVSSSLVAVAVSTVLLLAGAVEADNKTWYSVLALLMFATCTVLGDGVGWNANYLLHVKNMNAGSLLA
jgi:hypothetical protein